MNREITIEYETFEEDGIKVLSVVDREKDEVINMFRGNTAERLFMVLTGEDINKVDSEHIDSRDREIREEMTKIAAEINLKMNNIMESMESENLDKEAVKATLVEIRSLVDYFEELALERCHRKDAGK